MTKKKEFDWEVEEQTKGNETKGIEHDATELNLQYS